MTTLENLKKAMPQNIDAVLVTSELNQRYLTDFNYTDGYVLITRGNCYVIADSRYIEAAKNEVCGGFEVLLYEGGRKSMLGQLFEKENIKKIAFEDTVMTCADFTSLAKEFPEIEFHSCGSLIMNLREVKSEIEKNKIIAAQRIAEKAFDHILGYISPERTEKDVALELEYAMRKAGAGGTSFETIAVSGKASSMPHGVPRDVKLEKGFLTMDFGAEKDGYLSDMTRTVCIGEPDDEMKKVYDTVYQAQMAGIAAAKAGITGAELDGVSRKIIADAGYGKYFGHSLGHGVGMYIHESPRVAPGSTEKVLRSGNVVTIEPGIYLEGKFGVRIEDMVYLTDSGCEDLTLAPKQLIVL